MKMGHSNKYFLSVYNARNSSGHLGYSHELDRQVYCYHGAYNQQTNKEGVKMVSVMQRIKIC